MMKMIGRTILAGALSLSGVSAFAQASAPAPQQAVQLTSVTMVEVSQTDAQGKVTTVLKSPAEAATGPGTPVVFTLSYVNTGTAPATNFVAVNPLPGPVQFVSVAQDWAEVSVDGGKSFGKLAQLKVSAVPAEGGAAVTRAATAADVTTIRWAFAQAIPAGAKGTISYRGVVK